MQLWRSARSIILFLKQTPNWVLLGKESIGGCHDRTEMIMRRSLLCNQSISAMAMGFLFPEPQDHHPHFRAIVRSVASLVRRWSGLKQNILHPLFFDDLVVFRAQPFIRWVLGFRNWHGLMEAMNPAAEDSVPSAGLVALPSSITSPVITLLPSPN
jgi:hypothetical protein